MRSKRVEKHGTQHTEIEHFSKAQHAQFQTLAKRQKAIIEQLPKGVDETPNIKGQLMKQETLTTVRAILSADSETTEEQTAAILAVCSRKQTHRRLGTKHDAAAILGLHPESIKRYARRGLLHPIKITARRVRFDLDEVTRLANYGAEAGEGVQ